MMPEKSVAPSPQALCRAVDLRSRRPKRRGGAGGRGRLLSELQVLQHQGRGEPGLVVVARWRRRHRPRHRAVAGDGPALPRGGRGHIEQRLVREPQLLGQHERLADADHADGEDHVVADLGGLSGAGLAAVDDALAHGLQEGLGLREGRRGAAAHEGERRRLGSAHAARHGCVDREHVGFGSKAVRGARRGNVDGRGIDEQRAGRRGLKHAAAPDRQRVLARRQHGDHGVGVLGGLGRRCNPCDAVRLGLGEIVRHQVEALHGVALPDKVGSHGHAHVAEPDETDPGHMVVLPPVRGQTLRV